jgi:hypothetical protein
VLTSTVCINVQIRNVEESRFTGSDIDESRLNTRKNGIDPAQENVTKHSILVRTIEHDFGESLVFTERYPRFLWIRAHKDFSLQLFLQFVMSSPITPAGSPGDPEPFVASCDQAVPATTGALTDPGALERRYQDNCHGDPTPNCIGPTFI